MSQTDDSEGLEISQPQPRTTKRRRGPCRLPSTVINPGETMNVETYPQMFFRGERLLLWRRYPTLLLKSIKVGVVEQLRHGSLPMDVFQLDARLETVIDALEGFQTTGLAAAQALVDLAEEVDALARNLPLDACSPGMRIRLEIENTGPEPIYFEAALFGTTVYIQ